MRSKRAKRGSNKDVGDGGDADECPLVSLAHQVMTPIAAHLSGDDLSALARTASFCVTSATAPKDVSGGATRASHSSVRPTARCTSARGADQPAGTIPRNCGANSTATRASR